MWQSVFVQEGVKNWASNTIPHDKIPADVGTATFYSSRMTKQ